MIIRSTGETILAILKAIDDTVLGAGFKELYTYNYQMSEFGSYIELLKKDGTPVDPKDTFWLGMKSNNYL